MLATSGDLSAQLFGRPVPIEEDTTGHIAAAGGPPRRSIYLQVRRTKPVFFLNDLRRPGDGTQLRPPHFEHRLSAIPDADEWRFRAEGSRSICQRVLKGRAVRSSIAGIRQHCQVWPPGNGIVHAWQLAFHDR